MEIAKSYSFIINFLKIVTVFFAFILDFFNIVC